MDWSRAKAATIGVEIEMANITREKACRTIAAYFGTENTVRNEGGAYFTWSCEDRKGRKWSITRDSSILARESEEQTELATPVLHYEEDIADLQEIVRNLRHKGAVSDPEHGCGVHIHCGAEGHTAQSLRNLVNLMAAHEQLLINAISIDSRRVERYCKTVDEKFLSRLNEEKPDTMSGLADIWYESQHACSGRVMHYNTSRYHMVNLHSTFTKGTVEMRLFQFDNPTDERRGGLNAGQLKAYILLTLALNEQAKEAKTASSKKVQSDNPKYAMRCWLLRLGFIGDEFRTAREHLTKRLAGDSAFRTPQN